MPLSASDKLVILKDTLRGLEADALRAEAVGDEYRLSVLKKQIESANAHLEDAQCELDAEHAEQCSRIRELSLSVVASTPADQFTDTYEDLTVEQLRDRLELRDLMSLVRSSDRKADLIALLRGNDLRTGTRPE